MAKIKAKKCKCISSAKANNGNRGCATCFDVCTTGICKEADVLPLLVPVIYDEIGINLCRSIDLPIDIGTTFPTATCATVQVLDVTFATTGDTAVTIEPIPGRPNCYSVTLTNLTVTLLVKIYDEENRLLDTIPVTTTYLNPNIADAAFDEETNPGAVELEIYAPYGISYTDATGTTPLLRFLGYTATNNTSNQGLNLMAAAKVLHLDTEESSITVGLTLYLASVYYAGYQFHHRGKTNPPKGSLVPEEDSICMEFVEGSLLDMQLKPLELGPPKYEEFLKNDCPVPCGGACNTTAIVPANVENEIEA